MNWQLALKAWFDAHEAEGIELLADLVRQNTTNPPGNEYLVAEVVTAYLARHGITASAHEPAPGRTSVVALVGSAAPKVLVAAHTDVVPAGEGWHTDPFAPVVKDGFIFGRGVADNKGPLASLLLLAAFLKQHEQSFAGSLIVAAVADEECGSDKGMAWLLEKALVHPDYAIVPDTGESIYRISCAEKGLLHVEVVFHGKQAHGSAPEKGVNAIWAANAFLTDIYDLFSDRIGYCDMAAHDLLSPPSINIGSINGGTAYNIVPGRCAVKVDVRFLPGQTADSYLAQFSSFAEKAKQRGLCTSFELKTESIMHPFVVSKDSPLVQAARAAVSALSDKEIVRFGMSGTTVCKQLLQSGIPAIGWSQDARNQAHSANEHVAVSEISTFGQALGLAFLKLGRNW